MTPVELPVVEERCATCRFWADHDSEMSDLGNCHRYPPAMGRRIGPRPGPGDAATPVIETVRPQDGGWPMTFPGDWCGEWRAKSRTPPAPQAALQAQLPLTRGEPTADSSCQRDRGNR